MEFDYTLEEFEKGIGEVRTGLRRKLPKKMQRQQQDDDDEMDEGDEEDEDEDEDEVMEDFMPTLKPPQDPLGEIKGLDPRRFALRLNDVLKFINTGAMPKT
jgi:hypothetical protein